MQIVIKWNSGTEYLPIDLDNPDAKEIGQITETREWWPQMGYVYWTVRCTVRCRLKEIDGGHQVRVTYEEASQNDENIQRRIALEGPPGWFGANTMIVNRDPQTDRAALAGPCRWKDVDPKCNGSARWRILGRPRLRITREQWERDQQFRTEVLAADGKCVISGERTAAALDAAHICPVAATDDDTIGNGIILRADLHRLYDRGLFVINPEDGGVTLKSMDRNLSPRYRKLLQKARLPRRTLSRVHEALREKWENP